MLAEAATLAATDETRYIHLGTWLGEGEIAGAQAYLCVSAKHFLCKTEQHLFQVGKTNILINVKALYLMEETVCAGSDGFVAIDTPRTDNTYG
jgi:hypothetical protein